MEGDSLNLPQNLADAVDSLNLPMLQLPWLLPAKAHGHREAMTGTFDADNLALQPQEQRLTALFDRKARPKPTAWMHEYFRREFANNYYDHDTGGKRFEPKLSYDLLRTEIEPLHAHAPTVGRWAPETTFEFMSTGYVSRADNAIRPSATLGISEIAQHLRIKKAEQDTT